MNDKLSSSGRTVSVFSLAAVWIPSVALALFASTSSARASTSDSLSGTRTNLLDSDSDGLIDRLERVIGTSPHLANTDGDFFSDLEEFARLNSPSQQRVQRPRERLRVGMSAYGRDRHIHVVAAIYVPDGDFRRVKLQIGMASQGRIIEVSNAEIASRAQYSVWPAANSYARILLVDMQFTNTVATLHDVTYFATIGRMGTGTTSAADTVRLLMIEDVVVIAMPDPTFGAGINPNGTLAAAPAGPGMARTIFVPLVFDDEGEPPENWTPGQVCFQNSSTVGGNGSTVTQEVVSAECKEGWDGGCPPSCGDTVGSTSVTLDPLVLIGG